MIDPLHLEPWARVPGGSFVGNWWAHIESPDGRDPVELRFTLVDSDVDLLEKFLVESKTLFKSLNSIGGIIVSQTISSSESGEISITNTEPSEDQRAIILHRLRPLILQDEPYSFDIICSIVNKSSSHEFMRKHLRGIRNMYSGKNLTGLVKISHGDFVLNSDNGFRTWINGFEYHRDPEKVERIFSHGDMLTVEQLRPIFLLMVSEKIKAIELLSCLVYRMLEIPEQNSERNSN